MARQTPKPKTLNSFVANKPDLETKPINQEMVKKSLTISRALDDVLRLEVAKNRTNTSALIEKVLREYYNI